MTGNEYQDKAMRTNDGKCSDRLYEKFMQGLKDDYELGDVVNGCLGLSGEAGEVADLIKKWVFHGKELDREHLEKELGDVMWYIALICDSMKFDMNKIMQKNIDKLMARYPEGFDIARANNRSENDI